MRNSAEDYPLGGEGKLNIQNRRQTDEGFTLLRNESSINPIQNYLHNSTDKKGEARGGQHTPLKEFASPSEYGTIQVDHKSLSPNSY
jgi:hypothetical protein